MPPNELEGYLDYAKRSRSLPTSYSSTTSRSQWQTEQRVRMGDRPPTIKISSPFTRARMLQAKSQLTLQEFLHLSPGEGDITYELIDGQAVPKVSPKKFHSRLTRTLLNLIDQWCKGRGEVCPELAVTLLRKGRDWVPTPDLLYVSDERLPADWEEDVAYSVPPDLVIEIISPGQTFGQLVAKARDYLDAKVSRVWVVDSKARSITVFYPDAAPQTYMGDTLLADSLFEGLEFSPEQVFQQARIPCDAPTLTFGTV